MVWTHFPQRWDIFVCRSSLSIILVVVNTRCIEISRFELICVLWFISKCEKFCNQLIWLNIRSQLASVMNVEPRSLLLTKAFLIFRIISVIWMAFLIMNLLRDEEKSIDVHILLALITFNLDIACLMWIAVT